MIRGAKAVYSHTIDIQNQDGYEQLFENVSHNLDTIDVVLIAHGTLPDQKACEASVAQTLEEININALSSISLLTLIANKLEEQKQGTIAVISSVAGDRGRQSNYVYGASKAAVTAFSSGLRQRLFEANVHVLTIKPGFVETSMTKDLDLPKALTSQASEAAEQILKAIRKKKNTIYIGPIWRLIMFIITSIPDSIFKRLRL